MWAVDIPNVKLTLRDSKFWTACLFGHAPCQSFCRYSRSWGRGFVEIGWDFYLIEGEKDKSGEKYSVFSSQM